MERYKFHDVTLSSTIDNAYHALAVDERRKLFRPTLWEESKKIAGLTDNRQKIEQRWFPGVHCNIGGGYSDRGLSDQALHWMIQKAKDVGLCFNPAKLTNIKPDFNAVLRNSYTPAFWFWRRIWRTITLQDSSRQVIDPSVLERLQKNKSYRPQDLENIYPDFFTR